MVELIPVVEVEGALSDDDAEDLGVMPDDEFHLRLDQCWEKTLSDFGLSLTDIPWKERDFIPVELLRSDRAMNSLLSFHFDEGPPESVDDVLKFYAGWVFKVDGGWVFPGCCCDFSNIEEYRAVLDSEQRGWKMVWIGHPWIHAASKGEFITFSHPTENSKPIDPEIICRIRRSELEEAILRGMRELDRFRHRLRPYVQRFCADLFVDEVMHELFGFED